MTKHRDRTALIGAVAGIGFVLFGLMGTFLYPQPPRIDSASNVILRWVHHHRSGIAAGMIVSVFAALLFVWFAVYLQRRLVAAGEDLLGSVAYGSGIAYAAFVALGALPAATLVFMDGQRAGLSDGDVVRLLLNLYQILYAPATGLIAVFFVAVGLAALWSGVFSKWLGWATLVMAAICLVEVVPIMINSSYHPGPWAVLGWAGAVGSLLVPLAMCIEILRGSARHETPVTAAAALVEGAPAS